MSGAPLLTVDVFNAWQAADAAAISTTAARANTTMVDAVLRSVARYMLRRSLQDSCDLAWRRARGVGLTYGEKEVVRDTLLAIGWVRRPQRGEIL